MFETSKRKIMSHVVFWLLIAATIVLLTASIMIGPFEVSPATVWNVLFHHVFGTELTATKEEDIVVWIIRTPRAIGAVLIGATLAATGAAMQGLFRNPLADPGLIGISSGAAFAAAAGIVLGGAYFQTAINLFGVYFIPAFAFVGGVVATFFIYSVSITPRGVSVVTMLLAGIAINALTISFTGLLSFISSEDQLRDITFWQLGNLGGISWLNLHVCLLLVLVNGAFLLFPKALNAMLLGNSEARHLGFDVSLITRYIIILTALGVGISVAVAGIIGFVGIIVPHLLRLVLGPDYRFLLPNSMALGAVLLLASDLIARTIAVPAELPIGIITALIGAPVFLWILISSKMTQPE